MGTGGHRTIVVPLFEGGETERALAIACRLATDRGARVFLLAPLRVEQELPLDAHFDEAERGLHDSLVRERALVESFGVSAVTRVVRSRPGEVGRAVGAVAEKEQATLVVVAAETMPLASDVRSVLRHAPCRVLLLHSARALAAEQAA